MTTIARQGGSWENGSNAGITFRYTNDTPSYAPANGVASLKNIGHSR